MILDLDPQLNEAQIAALIQRLARMKLKAVLQPGSKLAIVQGVDSNVRADAFSHLAGVKKVSPLKHAFKLVSKSMRSDPTVIECRGRFIGGKELFVIAGPCSIESKEQMEACAKCAKESGATALRGGAYKPRTSPYEFQGLGIEGLEILRDAGKAYDLITVSEVMEPLQVAIASEYVDILQVGTRNMQNYSLLKELGKVKNPVLLKRGFSATYQDLLMAAEYIAAHGNPNIILCERGIRTFETYTRNTLDLAAIAALKEMTHLPIISDPSHGTGQRSLVPAMARASVAAGADGLMIEMHPDPDRSVSDAKQTVSFDTFQRIMKEARAIKIAIDTME